MRKTLLLCFIHGFKGDDDTFGKFPSQLRDIVQHDLPNLDVREIVYPKFETRGTLETCVARFRDWLQEQVIDLEVAASTPSPTVEPSVHTILIGHSMGGIVAADTLLSITNDNVISKEGVDSATATPDLTMSPSAANTLLFPSVLGILAFDTPYLGISPGVVAHGAEGHYNTVSSALTQLSGLTGAIWGGSNAAAAASSHSAKGPKSEPIGALPAPPTSSTSSTWQKYSSYALYAGAASALAATGTAAYLKRDTLTLSWTWVGSHLEFVNCLMKGEELRKRVAGLLRLNHDMDIGFANLYTRLGRRAQNKDGSLVGVVVGNQRTFCNLPKSEAARACFREAINDGARDEMMAHISMFFPKDNPNYSTLEADAKTLIVRWAANEHAQSEVETGGGESMQRKEEEDEL